MNSHNNTHYIEGKIETAILPNGKYYWKAYIYDLIEHKWDQVAKGTNEYDTEQQSLDNAKIVTINSWVIVKEERQPITSEKKSNSIIEALKSLLK